MKMAIKNKKNIKNKVTTSRATKIVKTKSANTKSTNKKALSSTQKKQTLTKTSKPNNSSKAKTLPKSSKQKNISKNENSKKTSANNKSVLGRGLTALLGRPVSISPSPTANLHQVIKQNQTVKNQPFMSLFSETTSQENAEKINKSEQVFSENLAIRIETQGATQDDVPKQAISETESINSQPNFQGDEEKVIKLKLESEQNEMPITSFNSLAKSTNTLILNSRHNKFRDVLTNKLREDNITSFEEEDKSDGKIIQELDGEDETLAQTFEVHRAEMLLETTDTINENIETINSISEDSSTSDYNDCDSDNPEDSDNDEDIENDLDNSSLDFNAQAVQDGGLQYLGLSQIKANPKQPRQYFAQEDIDSLANSVRESGLLQPILVRPINNIAGEFEYFEIIAGERRFRAAQQAGLEVVPAIIRNLNDRETLELSIVENIQRSDLNPVEEAHAYQRLIIEFGQTQNEIANALGKDRVVIANTLRLLKLCSFAQSLLVEKKISAGHGRALLMVNDLIEQEKLTKRILSEELSVRQAEQLASGKDVQPRKARAKKNTNTVNQNKSFAVIEIEDRLRRALGTKIQLNVTPTGEGDIQIKFFSKEELDRILDVIEKHA